MQIAPRRMIDRRDQTPRETVLKMQNFFRSFRITANLGALVARLSHLHEGV